MEESVENKIKELSKYIYFMHKAIQDSVTYLNDREKQTLKGILKIINKSNKM